MSSIRSKLDLYKKPQPAPPRAQPELPDLSALGLEPVDTPAGPVFRRERRFTPAEYVPACCNWSPEDGFPDLYRLNGLEPVADSAGLLFLDLETTGLSMGAGTYAFLCGLARFDGADLVVEQLFMASYDMEPALIHYLIDSCRHADCFVSFNGNTFDLPLLKNRCMINRIYGFPVKLPSIDLIVPSRRMFKKVLESCSLQSLERHLLGLERQDDTSGWMIPEIFFTFQKDANPDRLGGVLEHNMLDMSSMASLMIMLDALYREVGRRNFKAFETGSLLSLARHLYHTHLESFLDLAEYLGADLVQDDGLLRRACSALKRNDEWERAVAWWQSSSSIWSLQELAKYHEHRQRDYPQAREYTLRALELARQKLNSPEGDPLPADKAAKWVSSLEHRLQRLERKV